MSWIYCIATCKKLKVISCEVMLKVLKMETIYCLKYNHMLIPFYFMRDDAFHDACLYTAVLIDICMSSSLPSFCS
jgi:hypothetical protein